MLLFNNVTFADVSLPAPSRRAAPPLGRQTFVLPALPCLLLCVRMMGMGDLA